jgi:signal peptidase I
LNEPGPVPVETQERDFEPEEGPYQIAERETPRWLDLLRELLETIVLTVIIFAVINFATGRFRIEGPSMRPNLEEGQYLIVNKIVYRLHPPQRGDIVVFNHPRNTDRDLVKRIIGLPGETVRVQDGHVFVNETLLVEPYITYQANARAPVEYQLGPDEYFVLGDNRPNSDDSRRWGALNRDQIVGKVWISYWPPSSWGGVAHYSFPNESAGVAGKGIADRRTLAQGVPPDGAGPAYFGSAIAVQGSGF